jgi:hypothetical protein
LLTPLRSGVVVSGLRWLVPWRCHLPVRSLPPPLPPPPPGGAQAGNTHLGYTRYELLYLAADARGLRVARRARCPSGPNANVISNYIALGAYWILELCCVLLVVVVVPVCDQSRSCC